MTGGQAGDVAPGRAADPAAWAGRAADPAAWAGRAADPAAWAGRAADHAMGLELQLEELTEQRRRAEVQGRLDDAAGLDREIAALQLELARTAEVAAGGWVAGPPGHVPPSRR